ncbi:hypothetical protein BKA70DRAFT_1480174 [Coprinopsis sp. MPI-PUGE-AT-0042]|nr:hypothetical protein BKA70DRAFT_1480174 [Coprinopsis sp. MPI-PUGE-AT-0042]
MGMTKALEEAGITEADVQLRVIHLVGVCLEGSLYGVYLCLFLAASPTLVQRNSLRNFSAAVFVTGNILMFVLISIQSATSICLPIFAFAYQTDGISHMLRDQHHWSYFISIVLGAMVFLTGDVLVIYRCFLLWQRRYLVILIPCLLVALGISRDVGLVSIHTPKLLPIVRIFVESAVFYTAGVLVMAVLIALDHPAWFAMHSCMMPIIGIVFVLMVLRIHAVREESKDMPASPSLLPSWLVNNKTHSTDFSDPELVEKEEDQSLARTQTRPLRHPGNSPQSTHQIFTMDLASGSSQFVPPPLPMVSLPPSCPPRPLHEVNGAGLHINTLWPSPTYDPAPLAPTVN